MAGILKVDQYQDFNGNNIMTSDGSGNITVNATGMKNWIPAFLSKFTSQTGLSDAATVKLTLFKLKYLIVELYMIIQLIIDLLQV